MYGIMKSLLNSYLAEVLNQGCRGYEISHPYPHPYPQIFSLIFMGISMDISMDIPMDYL